MSRAYSFVSSNFAINCDARKPHEPLKLRNGLRGWVLELHRLGLST